MVLLLNTLINQSVDFVSVCSEYIMLGAVKVRVHLSRKQCILRDICPSRVFVQRQYK